MARIRSSEITPKQVYLNRRTFYEGVGDWRSRRRPGAPARQRARAAQARRRAQEPVEHDRRAKLLRAHHQLQQLLRVDSGAGDGPKKLSGRFRPSPWKIAVEGLVAKPASYALEDFIKPHTLEERIYRLRCVEAWSLVIPWIGIPLADVIKRVEPTSRARFVEFYTLHDVDSFRSSVRTRSSGRTSKGCVSTKPCIR